MPCYSYERRIKPQTASAWGCAGYGVVSSAVAAHKAHYQLIRNGQQNHAYPTSTISEVRLLYALNQCGFRDVEVREDLDKRRQSHSARIWTVQESYVQSHDEQVGVVAVPHITAYRQQLLQCTVCGRHLNDQILGNSNGMIRTNYFTSRQANKRSKSEYVTNKKHIKYCNKCFKLIIFRRRPLYVLCKVF